MDPNVTLAQPNSQAQQPVTLTGGNDATNRYIDYYNQFRTQLYQNPNPITYQAIELPREMQAQQISMPDPIKAERLATENRTYGEYADEAAAYLGKYLQNSIRERKDLTSGYRAAADADAWSRGMGASTFLTDAKNQLAKAEARDIMAAQNEFLGNVGQQAFQALQNQYNRNLQANMQNAANALAADQFNANIANAVRQYNANAMMDADRYNITNLLNVAMQNAQNQLETDMFNSQLYTQLEQLAWARAGDMYGINPVIVAAGGGAGGGYDNSGISGNLTWAEKLKAKEDALREFGYTPAGEVTFNPADYEEEVKKRYWMGGSKGNNITPLLPNPGDYRLSR